MGKWYLLITDYYSRFPEMALLGSSTAAAIVNHCKTIFARHGAPEVVVSDNGPQFDPVKTSEFSRFAADYGFKHISSSPRYPQSNGFVEAAVKIVKLQLKKNADPYKALMEYRSTPLDNGYSPAELLVGRRIRTTLPMLPSKYNPKLADQKILKGKEDMRREKQKNYDTRHGTVQKEELRPGEVRWVRDQRTWATVLEKSPPPRSYVVQTPLGTQRRKSTPCFSHKK
jgi:hypothetical protein